MCYEDQTVSKLHQYVINRVKYSLSEFMSSFSSSCNAINNSVSP